MHRRRKDKHRSFQDDREIVRTINHRRLRLERYESRLALSSVSLFQFSSSEALSSASTAEGGYIDVAGGDLVESPGYDFVVGQTGNPINAPALDGSSDPIDDRSGGIPTSSETFDPWQGPADSSSPGNGGSQDPASPGSETSSPTQSTFDGGNDLTDHITTGGSQEFTDIRIDLEDRPTIDYPNEIRTGVFSRSAEIGDELSDPFVSVSARSQVATSSAATHLEELYDDLRETMAATDGEATDVFEATSLSDDAPGTSEEILLTANQRQAASQRLMLSTIDGKELSLSADQPADQSASEEVVEGGAIDVASTVNQARVEHEARAFEAVATLLDEQGVVEELTTPAPQPLVGELARAVALELASFEGPASPIHGGDGSASRRGSAPVEVDAGVPLSYQEAETAQATTSTFSVAPWPLVFRAALGTAIVLWRRKSKSSEVSAVGVFEPKDE